MARLEQAVAQKLVTQPRSGDGQAAPPVGDPLVFLGSRNSAYAAHISGSGIEIGAFEHPAPLPAGCTTKYVDRYRPSEMAELSPRSTTAGSSWSISPLI